MGKMTPYDHPSLDYSKYSLHVSKNHLFKCVQNILKGGIYSQALESSNGFQENECRLSTCIVHLCQIVVIRSSVSMLFFYLQALFVFKVVMHNSDVTVPYVCQDMPH